MNQPNFFIVGAPKCGTSAMQNFLSQHPEIFMPEKKESHFFGRCLHHPLYVRDKKKYLSLFDLSDSKKCIGESSVFYLSSETAANEIYEFCQTSKIIIMLRNPVDMLYSLHSQYLYSGTEDIVDFEEALAAESERRKGNRIPRHLIGWKERLYYRNISNYFVHVERYIKIFGKDNVHIIIFDDFKKDVVGKVQAAYRFLCVDDEFRPTISIVNKNANTRSSFLRRALICPGGLLRLIVKTLIPVKVLRKMLRKYISRVNTEVVIRVDLDPILRQKLSAEFDLQNKKLGELLGKDLSFWSSNNLE
jgi:hypothetical protein